MSRELMLVGSMPAEPAMKVFTEACDHGLTPMLPRIPEGEQAGWVQPLFAFWMNHPALEPCGEPVPLTRRPTAFPFFAVPVPSFQLRQGHSAQELMIDDLGIAKGFASSFEQFQRARDEGTLEPGTRFVATLPGPATLCTNLVIPLAELFPMLAAMYKAEIGRVLELGAPEDLSVQLDLAPEVAYEEYRRRPEAWDAPKSALVAPHWPLEETISLIAELADSVPEPVELGFHLCAMYHGDESQGQDLNVHVDWANALARKIGRGIDYIHMPTTPDFVAEDFEPLARLTLDERTTLFLGVIHAEDGVDGAVRRANAAATVRPDFGVASYCGLEMVSLVFKENPLELGQILDIHREVALAT